MTKEEKFKKEFGERLKTLRKEKQLSIRKLAAIADMDHSQIHKIEKGDISPTIPTLHALAEALGVTPCDFFDC